MRFALAVAVAIGLIPVSGVTAATTVAAPVHGSGSATGKVSVTAYVTAHCDVKLLGDLDNGAHRISVACVKGSTFYLRLIDERGRTQSEIHYTSESREPKIFTLDPGEKRVDFSDDDKRPGLTLTF